MRVVKEAEERRNEILDAADMLFFADKGFDNTSTSDILEKVGIARGTLYYHFKSKRGYSGCPDQALSGTDNKRCRGKLPRIRDSGARRITGVVRAMSISHTAVRR